jgi:hypothetical protein
MRSKQGFVASWTRSAVSAEKTDIDRSVSKPALDLIAESLKDPQLDPWCVRTRV